MKKINEDYYLGYDIGTDSVGWAVTNAKYKLKRFRNNSMWGVRLFDESNTAEETRSHRCSSRRTFRRKQRIEWLQMLFDSEIAKVDKAFFIRLKESNLYLEDKTENVPYAVFADENYNDIDFYNDFKTIYHLRKALIKNDKKYDIRLVYLAVHHIIKHRGHFLFDNLGDDLDTINTFDKLFVSLQMHLAEEYDIDFDCVDYETFSEILKDKRYSNSKKTEKLTELCGISKKSDIQLFSLIALMCGRTVNLADIFYDESYKENELKSITFSGDYDEKEPEYQDLLNEKYELIEKVKAIYDWAVLEDIRNGEEYISFAKVKLYEEHKSDLLLLKKFVKEKCPEKYNLIFRVTKSKLDNYTAYSGKYKENGHNGVLQYRTNQEKFCAFLSKELKDYYDEKYADMFSRIENKIFMPKQISKDNVVIPMQLNRQELKVILDNASKYFDFLNVTDKNNISVKQKVLDIFDFRIPYYVGPLNNHSKKSWLVRTDEKIYPWNFNKVVDIEKSAEAFIQKLTSKCTYLHNRDVIPKNSYLYSKFMVLNELNNIKMNGSKLDVKLKQDIFTDLFLKRKKVTLKAIRAYIKSVTGEDVELTGIDKEIKSSMRSYVELAPYNLSTDEMEDVISAITIFGDDKKLLRKRLASRVGKKLSAEDIRRISMLKYKDWGAFSRELLTEIFDVELDTGEIRGNIINTLWNTCDNFMELIGSKYNFAAAIEEANKNVNTNLSVKDLVNNLYISPKVKRPVYQTLKITSEIVKIMGHTPKKIFVEMTRYDGIKGDAGRKKSRKDRLIKLYESCGEESNELYQKLKDTAESEFRRDKLYLYYTQFGRCMYSGEKIDIQNLYDNNLYDIDHIYPRSKVKDDSLDNRVLVKKEINAHKDNDYPLNADIRSNMKSHWQFLLEKGLISKKKYERLTRVTPFTDDELSDFIARQLVETGQSTKAVAELFKVLYPETEIVYVKAPNVSDFRRDYDMLKCRTLNDLHHAKDAYLNIVVGNVYNVKYTHNKKNFIIGLQMKGSKGYSLNKMFDFNINGAWSVEGEKSIDIVKKTMSKNNVIVTRYSSIQTGELFKLNPLKKGNGQVPLKQNSPIGNIEKYGGYDKPSSGFFAFVKHYGKKNKEIRQLVPIDNHAVLEYKADPIKYLSEKIGLVNPTILIPVVRYNSCLEFNNFRMNISSKSNGGKRIVYKPAMQLIVGEKFEKYIKKIEKLLKQPENYVLSAIDEISSEMNIGLYDELIYKCRETVFKANFGTLGNKLLSAKETFSSLSLREQCFVINELLKVLHNNTMSGDLRLIGESKQSGITTTNSALSEIKNISDIYLVNQSVTGLFEQKIDLLNM